MAPVSQRKMRLGLPAVTHVLNVIMIGSGFSPSECGETQEDTIGASWSNNYILPYRILKIDTGFKCQRLFPHFHLLRSRGDVSETAEALTFCCWWKSAKTKIRVSTWSSPGGTQVRVEAPGSHFISSRNLHWASVCFMRYWLENYTLFLVVCHVASACFNETG